MFFAPFPEEEILDSIAHRSLMRVNTVEGASRVATMATPRTNRFPVA